MRLFQSVYSNYSKTTERPYLSKISILGTNVSAKFSQIALLNFIIGVPIGILNLDPA
jgi:hypothetical protein